MGKTPTDMKKAKFTVTPAAKAFREFRQKLEREGWFKRNYLYDGLLIGAVLAMIVTGTMIARTYPIIASLILGIGI
jgi:hypothetical protein